MAGAPPCISHFSGAASTGRVQNEAQHPKKSKNMAGTPPCISHFSGAMSAGRVQNETQHHTKQHNNAHLRIFGKTAPKSDPPGGGEEGGGHGAGKRGTFFRRGPKAAQRRSREAQRRSREASRAAKGYQNEPKLGPKSFKKKWRALRPVFVTFREPFL